MKAGISSEGVVTGTRETVYIGQYASRLRNKYRTAKDSTEFVSKLASEENIQVKKLQMEGRFGDMQEYKRIDVNELIVNSVLLFKFYQFIHLR